MGILNVTPDSFSDGGDFLDPQIAVAAGLKMVEDGANLIDIGGESTRPGSSAISAEEERRRILPVLHGLRDAGVPISVDTRNASTMAAVLDAGASLINDISALAYDPAAAPLLAGRNCGVILMHMRGTPATMNGLAHYQDVPGDVAAELAARLEAAVVAGIAPSRIALDPGFGFAKLGTQNVELMQGLAAVISLGRPVVAGVSRKRFIGTLSGESRERDRLGGSLAAGLFAAGQGVAVLRVHDVAATVQALRVWNAMAGGHVAAVRPSR